MIWDLQYNVLLACETMPLPNTCRKNATKLQLQLVAASTSQALLILSYPPNSEAERQEKGTPPQSTILVIPYQVPPKSTIVAAMQRGSAGDVWLQKDTHTKDEELGGMPSSEREVIIEMKAALSKGNSELAYTAFRSHMRRQAPLLIDPNMSKVYYFTHLYPIENFRTL